MPRICIDMDETIADAVSEHLSRYNRDYGMSLSRSDLIGRSFYDVIQSGHREAARAYLEAPDFFSDLPVMPDSQRVIQLLVEKYEIFIATAAMEFPASFMAKYQWLKRYFPFVDQKRIIFCGDKSILHADYLIDDSPTHFRNFCGEGILFSAPHNHGIEGYRRVENWSEVEQMFLRG